MNSIFFSSSKYSFSQIPKDLDNSNKHSKTSQHKTDLKAKKGVEKGVQTNIKIVKEIWDLIDFDEEYQRIISEYENKLSLQQVEIEKLKTEIQMQKNVNRIMVMLVKTETQKIENLTQNLDKLSHSPRNYEFASIFRNDNFLPRYNMLWEEIKNNNGDEDIISFTSLSEIFDIKYLDLHDKIDRLIESWRKIQESFQIYEQQISANKQTCISWENKWIKWN